MMFARMILLSLLVTACGPDVDLIQTDAQERIAAPADERPVSGDTSELACSFAGDTGCLACCRGSRCCVVCGTGPAVCS